MSEAERSLTPTAPPSDLIGWLVMFAMLTMFMLGIGFGMVVQILRGGC